MKYCFYRLTVDSGFAPNPFYGFCTLAACTPNHQKARIEPGDVIVGYESDKLKRDRIAEFGNNAPTTNSLIFFMKVNEVLKLDDYYHDSRFVKKIPDPENTDYRRRMGDNAYFINENRKYDWVRGHQHNRDYGSERSRVIQQDIEGDRVFVAREYYYFGDLAVPFPSHLLEHVNLRGIKYCRHSLPELEEYVSDTAATYGGKRVLGNPISSGVNKICCRNNRKLLASRA